jgi:hypothetical protein
MPYPQDACRGWGNRGKVLRLKPLRFENFGRVNGNLPVRCDACKHLHMVTFIVDGRIEGAEMSQLLYGQADLFAYFPPDRCLSALASRDAPA